MRVYLASEVNFISRFSTRLALDPLTHKLPIGDHNKYPFEDHSKHHFHVIGPLFITSATRFLNRSFVK